MQGRTLHQHRNIPRKKNDRRHRCRRLNTSPFGSDEWIKAVQINYSFWPKQDRRKQERRSLSRRSQHAFQQSVHYQKSSLTADERRMLFDLTNND